MRKVHMLHATAWLALGAAALAVGACQKQEKKRTTIEMEGPQTERKITIESTKTADDDD